MYSHYHVFLRLDTLIPWTETTVICEFIFYYLRGFLLPMIDNSKHGEIIF